MRRLLAGMLFAALMAGPALGANVSVAPDDYAEIVLASPKASVTLETRLERDGYLSPYVLLPPPELGALHYAATDEAGKPVDLRGAKALTAGLYRVRVTADGGSPYAFNIALRLATWHDAWESNDTPATAAKVELPLTAAIGLRAKADADWFSFAVPGPGVLLVRLASPLSGPAPMLTVESDAQNDPALNPEAKGATPRRTDVGADKNISRHYFEVKAAGTWLARAQATADAPADGDETASRLDIVFYPDSGAAPDRPALVALGISPDDPNIQQIILRLRAEGKSVVTTNNPKEIAAALLSASRPPPPQPRSYWWYGFGAVLLLLLAAGGYFGWTYYRRRIPTA
jgi:hypothetical protein